MRRALLTLLPPVALVLLLQLAQWIIFETKIVSDVVGAGTVSVPALVTLLGFYLLRLVAIFVVPGWFAIVLLRIVRDLRAKSA